MSRVNSEVLEQIKSRFNQSNKNRGIKLPSRVHFSVLGDTIHMKLTAAAVTTNMQKDNGAFEGWALILKRWGNYLNISISWDKPDSIDNEHYQRFLFRLKQFNLDFNSWFSIDKNCLSLFDDLKINEQSNYLLSFPKKRGSKVSPFPEAVLEDRFLNDKELNESLMLISNASIIYRQLPVGVFENSVSKKTSIFTHGKSAIDIWGFSKENELLLYELKANENRKVGIISELYFYVNVLQMVRKNIFKYENCPDDQKHLLKISETRKIRAFLLCPNLHPLIDKELIDLLNAVAPDQVTYQYIKFNENYELSVDNYSRK